MMNYPLANNVPYTFQTASTLIEHVENIRRAVIDLQNSDNSQNDALNRVVQDVNAVIDGAFTALAGAVRQSVTLTVLTPDTDPASLPEGSMVWDASNTRPLFSDGAQWVDAMGRVVDLP